MGKLACWKRIVPPTWAKGQTRIRACYLSYWNTSSRKTDFHHILRFPHSFSAVDIFFELFVFSFIFFSSRLTEEDRRHFPHLHHDNCKQILHSHCPLSFNSISPFTDDVWFWSSLSKFENILIKEKTNKFQIQILNIGVVLRLNFRTGNPKPGWWESSSFVIGLGR